MDLSVLIGGLWVYLFVYVTFFGYYEKRVFKLNLLLLFLFMDFFFI